MKRLDFIRKKYKITDLGEKLCNKVDKEDGFEIEIGEALLLKIIEQDPTKNKMYVQWVLNLFLREVKEDFEKGNRFILEDLPKTSSYLELYEAHKRKKRFKEMALDNPASLGIKNPVDINQYSSLEQLYSVVYPFIPKVDVSELEEQMSYLENLKRGSIVVNDDKYIVFIPHKLEASELFSFTNWCTSKKRNTMFKHYTRQFEPDGGLSKLYIVIDKGFIRGENDNIYQVHFQSSQIMDKHDQSVSGSFKNVLDNSLALRNFFLIELSRLLAMEYKFSKRTKNIKSIKSNYQPIALKLGLGEALFSALDKDTLSIVFTDLSINNIPTLKDFKNLRVLYLDNVNITELREDMISSKNLRLLQVPRNKIKTLPKEIGTLKNLLSINLLGNPINHIPEEIKYLDPTNGGSLEVLACDIPIEMKNYLTKILPSVDII